MNDVLVPISPGELLDKITILRIKAARIMDPAKIGNVRLELELQDVNERLWDIEDRLRDKEAQQSFDRDFIALARAVDFCNAERAAIKKRVNLALGSRIVEEKSYKPYRASGL